RRPATGTPAGGSASDEKVVALSFDADMTADQGPRAKAGERFDNPELIALLRRLKVPSTVFMTGRWAEEYPAQAKDIGADDLFEVANHSYSHYAFTADCYGLPVVAKETMARDVERAFAAFREAGVRNVVPYFRFPGGCYDDAALRALAPANVTAVQWDVVSGDAFATDAGAVAR
ncbi:polysaccharide deacetylase, partial [Streptomyces cavourensis]